MSVQAVTAKMAEVELKDVAGKAASPAISPLTPKAEEKKSENNPTSPSAAAAAATVEPSPVTTAPNPVKMPQASAMKRPDPQQNGGEAFVNCDGTVAEAPRMKKVTRVDCAELPVHSRSFTSSCPGIIGDRCTECFHGVFDRIALISSS
uniref:Uncharacterized protein n=1 Tax=Cyprinus carpio TaxID=7962 RepID=A0A8C1JJV2_CYPCA